MASTLCKLKAHACLESAELPGQICQLKPRTYPRKAHHVISLLAVCSMTAFTWASMPDSLFKLHIFLPILEIHGCDPENTFRLYMLGFLLLLTTPCTASEYSEWLVRHSGRFCWKGSYLCRCLQWSPPHSLYASQPCSLSLLKLPGGQIGSLSPGNTSTYWHQKVSVQMVLVLLQFLSFGESQAVACRMKRLSSTNAACVSPLSWWPKERNCSKAGHICKGALSLE